MDLTLAIEPHETLVVTLHDGQRQTTVSVRPAAAGARSLSAALDQGMTEGYGECFWPGFEGGQYWWIFKRHPHTMEVMAMWTRGGAALWEHVFRAKAEAAWVHDRLVDGGLVPLSAACALESCRFHAFIFDLRHPSRQSTGGDAAYNCRSCTREAPCYPDDVFCSPARSPPLWPCRALLRKTVRRFLRRSLP